MRAAIPGLLLIPALASVVPCLHSEKRDVDRLTDGADAIVVGEVLSGQQNGHAATFVLSVARTLKGELHPGAAINVFWASGLSANKVFQGNYGLWFLQKSAGWTLQGVLHGRYPLEFAYFPLPKGSGPAPVNAKPKQVSVNDLVAAELVYGLVACKDRSQLYHLAAGILQIGESAAITDLYQSLRASRDPELKFIGLAGLVRANDAKALADIANDVDLTGNLLTLGLVSNSLCARRDVDPAAIRNLGTIATSPHSGIRGCAAQALKYIHTRDALPYLGQLLDSPDAQIRQAAMGGLSRFVDNLPVQTQYNIPNGSSLQAQGPTPYRTVDTDQYSLSRRAPGQEDEAEYLRFWKSWWSRTKDQLAAPGPVR